MLSHLPRGTGPWAHASAVCVARLPRSLGFSAVQVCDAFPQHPKRASVAMGEMGADLVPPFFFFWGGKKKGLCPSGDISSSFFFWGWGGGWVVGVGRGLEHSKCLCQKFVFGLELQDCTGVQSETEWALYKTSRVNGQKVAVESQCQECFMVWKTGYGMLSFAELVSESQDPRSAIGQSIPAVRTKIQEKKDGEAGPKISDVKSVQLELSRSFLVASESELRSRAKTPRLPKSLTKGLPQLSQTKLAKRKRTLSFAILSLRFESSR